MAATKLTEQQLVKIRGAGHRAVFGQRFVNPCTIHACQRVLQRRGERWAAEILGRDISRRSLALPQHPYFYDGEPDIIVLADRAEDDAVLAALEKID